MPTIVTANELRAVLGVSSSLYADSYLNDIIDASENVILPMLVSYSARINAVSLIDNVAYFSTANENPFSEGQSVVVSGVGAPFNGTWTVKGYALSEDLFTADITNADVIARSVIPAGTATLSGASTYVGNSSVEAAVLAVSVEIFQARTAAGGQIEGVDFTVSPFRLGRSLFNRVSGLLGPYLDTDTMVG